MRVLLLLAAIGLLGCGGRTEDVITSPDAATDAADSATTDTAGDGSTLCFSETVPSVPYKVCNNDSDCMVASHQTNCCGDTLMVGIAKAQASDYGKCETAWEATFPGCGCASGPPHTEDGKTIDFGTTPTVRCVDRTGSSGICKTFAP